MTVKTMRAIDRFAGVPLCWVSGLFNRVFRRAHFQLPSSPHTVLVIKFFGIGSVLLSTSFLSLMLQRFPGVRVVYLTFSSNREVLQLTGLPVEIITISDTSFLSFVATTILALRRLWASAVDVVFDLEFFSKFSTLISVLSGARSRVGFDLPVWWRRSNLTNPVALEHSTHVTGLFLRQLRALGIQPPDTLDPITLNASARDESSMEQKLGLQGSSSEVICININAGETSLERRWRPHRFVEVAGELVRKEPQRRIYFIGNARERRYVDAALRSADRREERFRNCCGDLSLGELVALLRRSSVLITNDSGPMHVAAAAGTPIVALFGPESPAFYGPAGKSKTIYKALSCSPCLNIYNAKQFTCPYNTRCMEEIPTQDVLAAVESLLPSARVSER
jgi:ADP-heptose:LPS heptosyltransferase